MSLRLFGGQLRLIAAPASRAQTISRKFLSQSAILHQNNNTSLFGDITEVVEQKSKKADFSDSLQTMGAQGENFDKNKVTVANDTKLQEHLGHTPTPNVEKYLSPLKRQLYIANVEKNGFFKNNQVIRLPDGEEYKLKLTRDEIDVLEPSLYVKSFRLKSSMKKATIFLRLISGLGVHDAITQAQFHKKKIGREVGEMLQDRLKDAHQLGLNPEELYISQIWCGSDGYWSRRLDPKARGKTGIIHHPYIHVRAILKTPITQRRLAWEKEQKEINRKPQLQLPNEKLRFRLDGNYKW